MREVLISIQPKWVELIVSGKKTVEVRKTKPKLETPFKVYIYETQGITETPWVDEEGHYIFKGRGKVIGEFVCDRVIGTCPWRLKGETGLCAKRTEEETNLPNNACLTLEEIEKYAGSRGRGIYAWHITDLVVYDEPRELSDFLLYNVRAYFDEESGFPMPTHEIARPFQSWGYVRAKEPRQTAD